MNKIKGKPLPSCNYSKNQGKMVCQMRYHCYSVKMDQGRGLRSAGRELLNFFKVFIDEREREEGRERELKTLVYLDNALTN